MERVNRKPEGATRSRQKQFSIHVCRVRDWDWEFRFGNWVGKDLLCELLPPRAFARLSPDLHIRRNGTSIAFCLVGAFQPCRRRKLRAVVLNQSGVKKMPVSRVKSIIPAVGGELCSEDLFLDGLVLFHRYEYRAAKECFQAVHDENSDHAGSRSYLGVCVGICDRRFEEAVALCTSASKQEFFNPEAYLNLARVYLHFGFKNEGRRFLLRGQMIDPANAEIATALGQLGARMSPVLRFLPRRHFINRWLGSARHRFGADEGTQVAA